MATVSSSPLLLLSLCLSLSVSVSVSLAGDAVPVIGLADGTTLRGSREGGVSCFKGIPFAEAPVRERRWTPPVAWSNPRPEEALDATEFGHTCVQYLWGDDGLFTEGDEDCLFLNVFVNTDYSLRQDQAPLPVAVFVHGGSYITGGSALPLYDGVDAVEYWSGKAIIVTTNYRLNVFGFLGGEELREGDPANGSTGNYGLQDQRLAFEWVRNNIGSFGGDPNRVTIFGESAGGGSMTNHLVAQKSWGLFGAVIMESGSFAEWASISMASAQSNYDKLLEKTGCENADCLKALPPQQLVLQDGSNIQSGGFGPVVDGVELSTHPWIALANGDVMDVPVLHGTNRDEGALFTVLSHRANEEQLHSYWEDYGYTADEIEHLDALYVEGVEYPLTLLNNSHYWWAGMRSTGDDLFSCPAQYASQQLSRLQHSGRRQSDTFMYYFEHLPRHQSLVRHVTELEYVFHQAELLDPADVKTADATCSYWGNFFSTHDPNVGSMGRARLSSWSRYEAAEDNLLGIVDWNDMNMLTDIKKAECDFIIPRLDAIIREEFT